MRWWAEFQSVREIYEIIGRHIISTNKRIINFKPRFLQNFFFWSVGQRFHTKTSWILVNLFAIKLKKDFEIESKLKA